MHQEIEIEFKNILTKDEFVRLVSTFQHANLEKMTQINHYLDTNDFQLKQHGSALRIREKNGTYQLTLKQPAHEGLLETHENIDQATMKRIMNEGKLVPGTISSILEKEFSIDPTSVEYFGSLTTNRIQLPYENGILVLDESTYLGYTDYELELEVPSYEAGKKLFEDLLLKEEIPFRKTKNKIVRFYEKKMRESESSNES